MLKKILIGIAAVIVLLLAVAFMLPSKIDVSKSISVNAPATYVYEEVNELRNWPRWSYWQLQDTSMQITYGAATSGANASYSWVGSDGPGSLVFTENTPDKSIKFDLRFMEDGDAAKGWYTFEPEAEGTKLTSGFVFEHGLNPLSRWFGFLLIEPEMKKAFEYELTKIKELAETKPKFTVAISEEDIASISYIGIKTTMSPKDQTAVSAQMAKSFTELIDALSKAKVEMVGHPFSMYPAYSEESMDMVCAVPVPLGTKMVAKYKVESMQTGKAIKGIHKGDYATLEATHNEVMSYIKSKNLEFNGAPWESYLTDPFEVKDTTQWITEVYYPVKK
jgi:effector-binding domain-containing protein